MVSDESVTNNLIDALDDFTRQFGEYRPAFEPLRNLLLGHPVQNNEIEAGVRELMEVIKRLREASDGEPG